MKMSQLFTKTTKNVPADEVSKNAQLLIRAGYVHKEIAGVYTYLPLGLRVLDNICQIIREEMDAVGGQEMRLTTLQDPEIWRETDRWDDKKVDIWFKTRLKNDTELGLGWTHEEPLVRAVKPFVSSYKDLPFIPYQIQTKLRNETRAKSGIMRGREFLMKDMYSFARTLDEHEELYEQIKQSYFRVFDRLGIGDETFLTFASGGAFTQFSHEFQTITEAGEDIVYLHRGKKLAVNEEVMSDDVLNDLGLKRDELEEVKTAEVGNIFTLKDRFSTPLDLTYTDDKGDKHAVMMGCYGIGPSRVMGVIAELTSDERGLVWPDNVAPYKLHIVQIGNSGEVVSAAENLCDKAQSWGISVLYDDTDKRPGEKFADADLLGMPHRVVVSEKTLEAGKFEYKRRTETETSMVSIEELEKLLTS